jgi:hypothetical protein
MNQLEIVALVAKVENYLANLERLAGHIHDKLHNHTPSGQTGALNRRPKPAP